jgi:hypothetical protein
MDIEKVEKYTELARSMGLDIDNSFAVQQFVIALQYRVMTFADPKMSDRQFCERMSVTYDQLRHVRASDAYKAATRVALAEFMDDSARKLMQHSLFAIYQENMPKVLLNVANLAVGKELDEDGNPVQDRSGNDRLVPERDQIAAATLFLTNPLASAWLNNTFTGESQVIPDADLDLRARLEGAQVLKLDAPAEVVEGEVIA